MPERRRTQALTGFFSPISGNIQLDCTFICHAKTSYAEHSADLGIHVLVSSPRIPVLTEGQEDATHAQPFTHLKHLFVDTKIGALRAGLCMTNSLVVDFYFSRTYGPGPRITLKLLEHLIQKDVIPHMSRGLVSTEKTGFLSDLPRAIFKAL